MRLKPRLMAIAEDIKTSVNVGTVYDIGADHALLPIWLIKNGYCSEVVASDIKAGPLEKAAKNISKYGIENGITLFLGDGFEAVSNVEDRYYVIIAGIGGYSLTEIIEKGANKARKADVLALQPMKNLPHVRKWLNENGYRINYESLAMEGRRVYNILFCVYSGEREEYTEADYLVGKRFGNCPKEIHEAYLSGIDRRLRKISEGVEKSKPKNKRANYERND